MSARAGLYARIVFGAVLVLLAAAIGTNSVLAGRAPEVALALWPPSAEARVSLSAQMLAANPAAPDVATVRQLARQALAREPVESGAAVNLAVAAFAEGRREEGTSAYRFAERLSRRDSGAQMLLIEDRVAQNDVAGALVHYDRALRVSPRVGDVLLPILVQASENEVVVDEVMPLLARGPSWKFAYLDRIIAEGSPESVARVLSRVELDREEPIERVRLANGLNRLAVAGEYQLAHSLYQSAHIGEPPEPVIVGGSFEEEPLLYPFHWWFAGGADLAAVREPREGAQGRFALTLLRSSGRSGEVARQLLSLAPGAYRLTGVVGGTPADAIERPQIRLTCGDGSREPFASVRLPQAAEGGTRFGEEIRIPDGCRFVWLAISTGAGGGSTTRAPWIDELALTAQ